MGLVGAQDRTELGTEVQRLVESRKEVVWVLSRKEPFLERAEGQRQGSRCSLQDRGVVKHGDGAAEGR